MEPLKRYLVKNFEDIFILLILVGTLTIYLLVPQKLAFLNFFFIPILLGAYYLGVRKALLGSVLCALVVVLFAYFYPQSFLTIFTPLDVWINVLTWASFLILTAAVVGKLTHRLTTEVEQVTELNRDLEESKARVEAADRELREYAENLENKVKERTDSLEKSKLAIEELKGKVEEALYSTMDASVVKLIIEKRLRTEKRKISVLFSDLKNFTRFSEERRPEVVITDLNRLLEEMEEVLLDYNAHIDKYLGDGIMVEFGAPTDYERHALMATVAGLKMQERVSRGEFPWHMRVGIATGEPIIGLIGQRRQTYTAIGDVVNLASRIQELCSPEMVTVDQSTFDEVHRFVDAKKKTVLTHQGSEDPELVKKISALTERVEEDPEDATSLKALGALYLEGDYIVQANEFLGRAMQIDPRDSETKLAYAEATLKMNQMDSVSIRGRKGGLHLYEIIGVKDPLLDRERVPNDLYERYFDEVDRLAEYPEDLILPMEVKDGSVGHSRMVGFLSYALADVLGLTEREKLDILMAGYFADLGKAIVPHHLLNRAGSLSKDEYEMVTKHSRESVRMLRKMGHENESMFEIIEATHENYNGSGYPAGLTGEDIPLGGRIIAVADTYNALTCWRPYRDRWDNRAAFSEMERDTKKGKFDPQVLESMGKLVGISS